MRHIPLSLYIDTEFFVRKGLRLNGDEFLLIKDKIRQKALRLLVPEMMERELLRHYKRRAKECSDAIKSALKTHPLGDVLVLTTNVEELESECFERLRSEWESFKSHFTVVTLPLVGDLEEVVKSYFSIEAPFSDKKPKEFPDAFILSALDKYNRDYSSSIALISRDRDFIQACQKRRHIKPYENLEPYVTQLSEWANPTKLPEPELPDLTKPIITEDLREIKSIMSQGSGSTDLEENRLLRILTQQGESYRYFFLKGTDPHWLGLLVRNHFFATIPNAEHTSDGGITFPYWPPIKYLQNVCQQARDEVFQIISDLPETENPWVLDELISLILEIDHPESLEIFKAKLERFICCVRFGYENIIKLLNSPFFSNKTFIDIATSLLLKIVEFIPRSNDSDEVSPRFGEWEFQQILERGVYTFAEKEPFLVSRLLIDAVAGMLRLNFDKGEVEGEISHDHSEYWCRRLSEGEQYDGSKTVLVHALTHACEQVYSRALGTIEALNEALKNQQWSIFRRLRQHLYTQYPTEKTKLWIREMIVSHKGYAERKHSYEFNRMIRVASETFSEELLTKDDRAQIFNEILSGPPKLEFKEWMAERFSEEGFEKRKAFFHREQLQPFESILFGEYLEYYSGLKADNPDPIPDADYSPFGKVTGGTVSFHSPETPDALSKYTDEQLLNYINTWEESRRDPENWLVEINISALADAFQTVFTQQILTSDRLDFWLNNISQIQRPVYVRAVLLSLQSCIQSRDFTFLAQTVKLARWILERPVTVQEDGSWKSDETREKPNWNSSRRAVGDLLDLCLKEEIQVPITWRSDLSELIETLCTQPDARLDNDERVILSQNDPVSEAINNTRSRALETVIHFGQWVRRQDPEDPVQEVGRILGKRLDKNSGLELTLPEYALLGMNFVGLVVLDESWAGKNKDVIFLKDDPTIWTVAFSSLLRYTNPFLGVFNILRDDFIFALDHLNDHLDKGDPNRDWIDTLGQHLFTYYLRSVDEIDGPNSLLGTFYQKTKEYPKRWKRLFDHIGILANNSGQYLDDVLKQRLRAFVGWRLNEANSKEVSSFTFWLEAECLDAEWRLDTFSQILDITTDERGEIDFNVKSLYQLLPTNENKVVTCFSKLAARATKNKSIYIHSNEAKEILRRGLASTDEVVRKHAEGARECLLKVDRFEFLDV